MIKSFSRMKRSLIFKKYVVTFVFIFIIFAQNLFAFKSKDDVGITFTFANGEITTSDDTTFYEFDVMAAASEAGTKIGTGIALINYNTAGFGSSIHLNGKVTVKKGTLTTTQGPPLYIIIVNDNQTYRLAITFEYISEPGWGNDLPDTATQLVHVKIEIADQTETAGLSFAEDLMSDQQYYDDNATKYNPVIATDIDNSSLPVSTADILEPKCGLLQNTPNPFGSTNTSTEINFVIDKTALAEVKIYNIQGQLIKNLYRGIVNRNEELSLDWDGKDDEGNILPSGIYFYQLKVNGKPYDVKRLILLR